MDKQLLKAFALSIAILLGWQIFMSWYQPQQPAANDAPPATETATAPATPAPNDAPPATAPATPAAPAPVVAATAVPERDIIVRTANWEAKFSNKGGVATSWKLLTDQNGQKILADDNGELELISPVALATIGAPLRLAVTGDDDLSARLNQTTGAVTARTSDGADIPTDAPITIADGQTVELAFAITDAPTNQVVTKKFTFTGGQFDGAVTVDSTAGAKPFGLVIGPRIGDQSVKKEGSYSHTPPQAIVVTDAGKSHYLAGSSVSNGQQFIDGIPRWAGVADNYFGMIVATTDPLQAQVLATNAKLKLVESDEKEHDFVSVVVPVPSGKPAALFVGPKDPRVFEPAAVRATSTIGAPVDYTSLINYGFFWFLTKPLMPVIDTALHWTNVITSNYGWSIIIVTALFNLVFFPLRYKSSVSMKRAAKLQPQMKELQAKMKKYKPTDPQFKELQTEQMALMKQGNPLGGCLPLLLQFPFFWAFFTYFSTSFVVRKQPWIGWVHDLTAPDPYYILPVLMCAAQIGSMLITPMPNSDDPAMKMQRRLMTWVMPIAFTYFFFITAPSGLMLYWMTLNLVGIGIQYVINKMMPPDVQGAIEPPAKTSKKSSKKPPAAELVGSEK